MELLLIVNLVFLVGGVIFMALAYKERNKNFPWFSFRLSPLKYSSREAYNEKGFKYYCLGVPLIVIGGLSGAIYWLARL